MIFRNVTRGVPPYPQIHYPRFYLLPLKKVTFTFFQWSVLLTHYCAVDKLEKNMMGGACSAYGGRDRRVQGFGGETWGKETTGETQT
jgi:hypothetical protein